MQVAGHTRHDGRIAQWFPLVPRPRPPCRALTQRVQEIRDLAHAASHGTRVDRVVAAAEAHNKAALILSDCGLTDMANQLCWKQYDIFQAAAPLTAKTAKLALQPIINLGRLLIRAGHGDRAYQVFQRAYDAMRTGSATTIDERDIDLGGLVDTADAHRELRRFLWTVLLADGTRALTTSGQWNAALRHVEHHKGIGTRLLDGRQVAILAHSTAGNLNRAINILDTTNTPEPWEQAVAAHLHARCRTINQQPAGTKIATMVNHYLHLAPEPGQAVFRTRLGLAVLELTVNSNTGAAHEVAARICREALDTADAYLAWDVLNDPNSGWIASDYDRRTLATMVESSGLHRAAIPADDLDEIDQAVCASGAQLARLLTVMPASLDPR
ncbi:hypothetical protein associated with LanBC [Alloactinosynnema sp. L-07]|uniref:hypothetical protein n=1 Tax=Alloactinosynnema sp. L-07 TaxID=1653480 RepID=UPI00065EF74C|nr:hypothetical protein [Alloactinosynnema sp. L-07]CRK57674.1 hypothetical protein associated with LanBC [Alloactinosynnema sp. L-07]